VRLFSLFHSDFFFLFFSCSFLHLSSVLHKSTTKSEQVVCTQIKLFFKKNARRNVFYYLFNFLDTSMSLIFDITINLLLIILFSSLISAFYLPGLAPNVFCKTQIADSKCKVSLKKNRIFLINFSFCLDSN